MIEKNEKIKTMYLIAALYQFTPLQDPVSLKCQLETQCKALGITGALILAQEGINGTIAGPPENMNLIIASIKHHFFNLLLWKILLK